MIPRTISVSSILVSFFLAALLPAQVRVAAPPVSAPVRAGDDIPLKNWSAPLYWQPPQDLSADLRALSPHAVTLPTSPMVFIAMTPCRVVDTRASQHFPDPFGQPSLVPGIARTFTIQTSTLCSIPSTAQAYSLNVTLVPPGVVGYLKLYPHGQPEPNIVTLDDLLGTIVNNAAIVPAGAPNGAVDALVNGNTDLVLDINGYYTPLNLSDQGKQNTAVGYQALFNNTSGIENTATGSGALSANTNGSFNTANGYHALLSNTSGNENTAFGELALFHNIGGSGNTVIGVDALSANTFGNGNIAVGELAGSNITGNANIDIGNPGASTDTGIIRIGNSASHSAFVVAGVWGRQTNPGPVPVLIDQFGLLGTQSSSRRYKQEIEDMSDASSGLLRLRPVKFRYRKPYPDGSQPIDYGLIAEEVAEIYPDLVVKGKDGQVETVQYQKLTPMLLNELQKDHETIRALQAQMVALQQRLVILTAGK